MERTTKEYLSVYYWLEDLLPDFIEVKDEYPQDPLTIPSVSLVTNDTMPQILQLGGDDTDYQLWSIYVFAGNKTQRDDYLSKIYADIEDGICVRDYDQGFPPDVIPDQIGSLVVVKRKKTPIRVFKELVKKKYWHGVVNFTTYFTPTT